MAQELAESRSYGRLGSRGIQDSDGRPDWERGPRTTTLQLLAPTAPRRRTAHRRDPREVIDLTIRADHRLLRTVEEAAERLGIGRSLMYELISSGQITSIHVGRLRRITPEALRAYIAARHDRSEDGPDPAA